MSRARSLTERFQAGLRGLGLDARTHLVVAVSGGCDSVCLLHLLRFHGGADAPRLTAAHFDHAMRPDSAADAEWVAGLCTAWAVPLVHARAGAAPCSETQARRVRHRFLRRAAQGAGATRVATAHHADDQAETVLFRVLRGTGLEGLAGIDPQSPAGLVRPLLPFWREELEAYAREAELRWREDASNRTLGPVRNRLRHEMLPELERRIAPGARRSLVRLAALAREAEVGWAAVLDPIERDAVRWDAGAALLVRERLRQYHPALTARLVRRVLGRIGRPPDQAGTRLALQFITDAPSGKVLQLPGGLRLATEFGNVRIGRDAAAAADTELRIEAPNVAGTGELRLGGRSYRVAWALGAARESGEARGAPGWSAAFDAAALEFPLRVRAPQPGDRIGWGEGSRRLKRLFAEGRVPRAERAAVPVLVDAAGTVHWAAGLRQNAAARARPGHDAFHLTIVHG